MTRESTLVIMANTVCCILYTVLYIMYSIVSSGRQMGPRTSEETVGDPGWREREEKKRKRLEKKIERFKKKEKGRKLRGQNRGAKMG